MMSKTTKLLLIIPGIIVVLYAALRMLVGLQNYRAATKYKHDHPGNIIDLRVPEAQRRARSGVSE